MWREVGFEGAYAGTPPWDIGRPQGAFVRLAEAGAVRGRVLDVGCGTGEHALMAAGLGLEARFLIADALDLAALGEPFDTVLDCGLFHVFDDHDRRLFVDSLGVAVEPGGRYFMLCFSDRQPGDWGPRRVRQDEIRSSFADGWRIDSIEPAVLEITIDPAGAAAWLAALTRTP